MKRALILNAVLVAGMTTPSVESVNPELNSRISDGGSGDSETAGQSSSLIVTDLKTAGLWPDVEEEEKKLLLSNRISTQQQIDASWLGESITCLLWALTMIPRLPAYDLEADPTLLSRLRSDAIPDLIRRARLRPKKEIEKQRDTAERWHWRARTRRLQELGDFDGRLVGGRTIEQIIERAAINGAKPDNCQTRSQVISPH